jgi:hypothetical protein
MAPYNPLANAPIIGPWTSRIGKVVDILATPCDVSPYVFVQAFWHSAPVLLASLYKPDPVDYLTDRGGRPHKKGRNRNFRPKDFMPGDPGTIKGKLGWASFAATSMIERVGWYLLVADATTQFAVNWTSLAYQWSGCKVPGNPYCRSICEIPIEFPLAAGTYTFNSWSVQSQSGFFGDTDSIGTPPGFQSNVMLSFLTKPHAFPPFEQASVTNVQLVDDIQDRLIWEGAPQQYANGEFSAITLERDYLPDEGAHDYRVIITKTQGHYDASGSHFMVYGGTDRGLSPDP